MERKGRWERNRTGYVDKGEMGRGENGEEKERWERKRTGDMDNGELGRRENGEEKERWGEMGRRGEGDCGEEM